MDKENKLILYKDEEGISIEQVKYQRTHQTYF